MQGRRAILVGRQEITRAGGIRAAVEEALSLAALGMIPNAMTAYEAVGTTPTETEELEVIVIVEVRNEEELREAVEAGAQTVRLMGMDEAKAGRLQAIGHDLREDLNIETD